MKLEKLTSALLLSALFVLPVAATAETAPAASTDTPPAASAEPMFGDYQAKGFLSDYSKISKTRNPDGSYEYKNTAVDYSKYNKLLVDRIKIFFKDDSEYKGIDPDELKVLTDYFYEAIKKEVGDAYPMVSEPGPDVLRLTWCRINRRPLSRPWSFPSRGLPMPVPASQRVMPVVPCSPVRPPSKSKLLTVKAANSLLPSSKRKPARNTTGRTA